MRGISLAWRCTKFPFIPMALFSVALLLWWEKKPFFSALLSAQNGVLRVSPDIFLGSPMTSLTPGPNVDVHSHMPGVVWNSSLDNGEKREAGESNHNTSAKETLETDTVGSYDLSTRSQQQIFTDYKSPAFASNDTLDNREDQAVDAESQNIFAKPPASASKKDNHEDQAVDVEAPNVPVYPLITSNKVCNFAKGKWVTSENRPFYSGFECKRWLSAMWACRMTQRTDFAYEKFRWKPHDCELEEFDGAKFLRRMQDKTLALVGDSLGRQQFQSLMCMITGGKDRDDVEDVGKEFGLIKTGNAIRPDGWAYRFPITNTTIVFYWSSTLCDIEPIDPSNTSTEYAMHLDRPPAFLRKYFLRFDAVVLNTGHHWNRGKVNANKWVMYLNGQPNTDRRLSTIGSAKEFAVHSVIKWVDSQLTEHPKTKAFFRSISPRHFFNGDWNTGGTCDNTNPLSKSMEVLNEVPSDGLSSSAVKDTKVKLLDITGPSEVRDEGHISRYSIKGTPGVQDCLHWCLPGVPDTWNEILFAQL